MLALVVAGMGFIRGSAAEVVVRLKNGDRLTGDVISENADRILLKASGLGTIRLPKAVVAGRESVGPVPASVVPAGAATPAARTAVRHRSGGGAPAGGATNGMVARPMIPYVRWVQPFLTNWHGSVQVGTDLGFGTTDRETFYGNFTATHAYQRLRNHVEYHATYGLVNDIESANRMDGGWKIDYDLGIRRRLYPYNSIGAGYDEIRKVDREFREGAGMGYKVLVKDPLQLNLEAGFQFQQIDYIGQAAKTLYSIQFGESLGWKASEKLRIQQRLSVAPAISDPGDFRARFDLMVAYPILKRVTLNLNLINQYDATPPRAVDANDLQVQSTVGIVF